MPSANNETPNPKPPQGGSGTAAVQTTKRCSDCVFFAAFDSEAGSCRKSLPMMLGESRGRWPTVMNDDWCSQFEGSLKHRCPRCKTPTASYVGEEGCPKCQIELCFST